MAWLKSDFDGTQWRTLNLSAAYFAPAGDDRNDGHPKRPVRSAARAAQIFSTIIGGPGTFTDSNLVGITLLSDQGGTVFEGGGAGYFAAAGITAVGVEIRNYIYLARFGSCTFSSCKIVGVPVQTADIYYNDSQGLRAFIMEKCLVIDSFTNTNQALTSYGASYVGNTFINSALPALNTDASLTIRDNILDASSELRLTACSSSGQPLPSYLDYCAVLGPVVVKFRDAGGVAVCSYAALADFQVDAAAYGAINGKAALRGAGTDLGFANAAAGDYTLLPTSSVRNDSLSGSYIGAYGIGFSHTAEAEVEIATNAVYDAGTGGWVPVDPAQDMVLEYYWQDYGQSWALEGAQLLGAENVVQGQTIDASLSYEVAGGVPVDTPSGNVLANTTYHVRDYSSVTYNGQQYTTNQFFAGVAGVTGYATSGAGKVVRIVEMPNARVFEYQYAVNATTLAQAQAEGDARGWKRFIFNRQPTYNVATGKTNGEVGYNPAAAEPLIAAWGKPRLTLKAGSLP